MVSPDGYGAPALYVPWVVAGELYYGAERSSRREAAISQIQEFLRITIALSPDVQTAEHYGAVKAELARAGTPIPDNDIWIAALAREYKLPVVTRDKHFNLVAGLEAVAW